MAPSHERERWMWLRWQFVSAEGAGVDAQLRYGRHPSLVRYELHILLFQMMYMTPSRRALANWLPLASVASSHVMRAPASARWAVSRTLKNVSSARPSKCSEL